MDVHHLLARERGNVLAEVAQEIAQMEREAEGTIYAVAYRNVKERVLNKIVEA